MHLRLTLLLAACGLALAAVVVWLLWPGLPPPRRAASTATGAVRVTCYHYWDDAFAGLRDRLAVEGQAFCTARPDVRLVVQPVLHEAYKVNAPALMSAGAGNELFSWWAGWRTRDLDDRGLIAPIDDWWQAAHADRRFDPAVVELACTYRGRRCLLPLVQCYIGFFYNTQVFTEAGVAPPATWPDLLAACRVLRSRGINPIALGTSARWPAQFWFDFLLLRTAGHAYRQRLLDGQASWTDPEVVRAFALWRELIEAGAFNPNPNGSDWLDAAKMVHTRGAAMILMGTWVMDPFAAMGWQGGRDYGWFPFPVIDPAVEPATLTVVDGLVVGAGSGDRLAVHAVLDHLATPSVQAALAQASGNFAPHVGVGPASYDAMRAQIRASVGGRLAFAYDLATPPEVERIGLATIARFLDHPDEVDHLLAETQQRMAACFAARTPR